MKTSFKFAGLGLCFALAACGYPQTEFVAQNGSFDLTGVIDGRTLDSLQAALEENPGITTIRFVSVPGSADDEASLEELASFIRGRGMTTVVPSNGMVASGGTDMVLMGKHRVIASGACIGVHSWASAVFGQNVGTGAELSRDDEAHDLYLDFYDQMGIPQEFYWYTLEVADADDIHWMSPAEINRFGLSSVPVPASSETPEARAERCWARG